MRTSYKWLLVILVVLVILSIMFFSNIKTTITGNVISEKSIAENCSKIVDYYYQEGITSEDVVSLVKKLSC